MPTRRGRSVSPKKKRCERLPQSMSHYQPVAEFQKPIKRNFETMDDEYALQEFDWNLLASDSTLAASPEHDSKRARLDTKVADLVGEFGTDEVEEAVIRMKEAKDKKAKELCRLQWLKSRVSKLSVAIAKALGKVEGSTPGKEVGHDRHLVRELTELVAKLQEQIDEDHEG